MLRFLTFIGSFLFFAAIVSIAGAIGVFWYFGRDLPDHVQLASYEPPVMTRVHAGDGSLFAEYAIEKRVFVPIEAIPDHVIQAFLSAEDKTFYSHPGIDVMGVATAALRNLRNIGKGRRPTGASTITQQVAKNFLLTNEVSYKRKIREAILAFRIEKAFSKDRILELYLNEIYLGLGSYGVAMASQNYFDKSLDELTVEEVAYLAALPKAPSNYHPTRKREAAIARRNWVLGRMAEDGAVTADVAAAARAADLGVKPRKPRTQFKADYFAETIRRELAERFGEKKLYEGGMLVKSTLNPELQQIAERVLRKGLVAYDRRHGWRGPLTNIPVGEKWAEDLAKQTPPDGLGDWRMALVLKVTSNRAEIGFADGGTSSIPFSAMTWARPWKEGQRVGPAVKKPSDVVKPGDVVVVELIEGDAKKSKAKNSKKNSAGGESPYHALRQIPDINGAIVVLDPHTGRVLAMVGGFSHDSSEYNRATQALRQPGSAFKPIVYAAALDNGFHPASIVVDGPFVIDQGRFLGKWKPRNYSGKFYGPSTLRLGMELSRNLMTVRLAQYIGINRVIEYAKRLGVADEMEPFLPMALGAGETTLLRLTAAYGVFVNGGKKVEPTFIDRIQDRRGKTIYRHDARVCDACLSADWQSGNLPVLKDEREQILDPRTAYQMVSLLQGVVQRGTGSRIARLGKPLAGKTGTTNETRDTWFVGFSPDLAVGVFAGFDNPKPMGRREQGASVAAPIFQDFFAEHLKGKSGKPFRVPKKIKMVRIHRKTGVRAGSGGKGVIFEAFKEEEVPTLARAGHGGVQDSRSKTPRKGTGGLY